MRHLRHATNAILAARRRFLTSGFRKRDAPWAFELLLLFSLLMLVAFALPEAAGLNSISPHPFWIPVLLLCVQYGTTAGLVAAVTATALLWLIGWPVQAGGEDFYDYSHRVWREPILWLGAALILGGFRVRQLDKVATLGGRLEDANAQRQAIAVLCETLKSHCQKLERCIASAQDRSIEAGLSTLANVRHSKPEALRSCLAAAVELFFGPASYALLLRRDDGLVESPEFASGADIRSEAWSTISANLEDALLRERRVMSILREEDAYALAGTALFAAPIVSLWSDRVIGAFLITRMDASRIGPDSDASLQAVCRALAQALNKEQVLVQFERDQTSRKDFKVRFGEERCATYRQSKVVLAIATESGRLVAPAGRSPAYFASEQAHAGAEAKAIEKSV